MRTVQLRRLADVNPSTPEFDRLEDEAEVTFAPLETVWADGDADFSRRRPKRVVATGYTRFRDGDVLVPKVTPTFQAGRVAVAAIDTAAGAGTTELHVLRARPGVDPRFLAYVCRSRRFLTEGVAAFQGVAGLQRVPDEFVRRFLAMHVPLAEQQRIADFLDAETLKLGRMRSLRLAQLALLERREQAMLDRTLLADEQHVPLRSLAKIQGGVTVDSRRTGAHLVERPYLRVANVKADRLDLKEVKTIALSPEHAAASTLVAGNVLMTEGGDLDKLGRGTLWRGEIPLCVHQNHVFALRPGSQLSGEFLALLTRTSLARAYFESTGTRTTNLASTNSSKIGDFRIPLPERSEQMRRADRAEAALALSNDLRRQMQEHNGLLHERQDALISSAVTGQIDVTTAQRVA